MFFAWFLSIFDFERNLFMRVQLVTKTRNWLWSTWLDLLPFIGKKIGMLNLYRQAWYEKAFGWHYYGDGTQDNYYYETTAYDHGSYISATTRLRNSPKFRTIYCRPSIYPATFLLKLWEFFYRMFRFVGDIGRVLTIPYIILMAILIFGTTGSDLGFWGVVFACGGVTAIYLWLRTFPVTFVIFGYIEKKRARIDEHARHILDNNGYEPYWGRE